ncbi:MAG TPA: hypothetical protein VNU68_35255 [Verrucomicrobiae bacterium]|nr:hypothetical protein [Verrucomicrobiae bacterium]
MASSLNWHRPRRIEPTPAPLSVRITAGALLGGIILGLIYIMMII